MTDDTTKLVHAMLRDLVAFAQGAGITLRSYQAEVAEAIQDSVINHRGHTIVVIFPRQSGKNELQSHVESYLMTVFSNLDAEIIKVSPTWKPQSLNAMRRLERVLRRNALAHAVEIQKEQGYIFRLHNARIFFLSGSPTANVVGATANMLLECDEAQDVTIDKWDKDINPMAASTNATRVFWGTAWTSKTLLAREKRAALKAQEADGCRRVFELTAEDVREEVQSYGDFVDNEIAKLGRQHPFIKTQFFSEEIDAEGGMFPTRRIAAMLGSHPPQVQPEEGKIYAFTIDVAGQEEVSPQLYLPSMEAMHVGGSRDSTCLTIFEVDLSTNDDPVIQAPRYLVVHRQLWTGVKHTHLYAQLRNFIEIWNPRHVVVDATGVGETIASFLDAAFPTLIIPFKFSAASKSKLGWDFIALIETGRYREYAAPTVPQALAASPKNLLPLFALQKEFFNQCEYTQMEILPGPAKMLRWSAPEGTRDAVTGELVHDDLVISAALASVLDHEQWGAAESEVIQAYDPLQDMKF
jgi:hypothetical protein